MGLAPDSTTRAVFNVSIDENLRFPQAPNLFRSANASGAVYRLVLRAVFPRCPDELSFPTPRRSRSVLSHFLHLHCHDRIEPFRGDQMHAGLRLREVQVLSMLCIDSHVWQFTIRPDAL